MFLAYEEQTRLLGYQKIAGVDEAGRGPLAGPVVVGACILPEHFILPGIQDSKKLSAKQLDYFYDLIENNPAIIKSISVIEPEIIDKVNILQASLIGMSQALNALVPKPDYAFVDGNHIPLVKIPCKPIIKGDTLSQSIMAAAILAKVTRDRLMKNYHQMWPEYGFDRHKGYPTLSHRHILKHLGPCPIHRKSFLKNLFS